MGGVAQIKSIYKPIYTTKKRYIVLTGGRGSGKTHVIQDFLIRLLEQAGQGVLYTRYTMTSAEKTIIPLFFSYISQISDINKYSITKEKIINKETNSFVLFSGIKTSSGDQTANLKSLPNITTWVIEEGEDYNKPNSFRDIDDSIRSNNLQNRVIWIQNPSLKAHFFYQRFFKGHEIKKQAKQGYEYMSTLHPNVEHIHTSYLDNLENLDIEKIEQWEEEEESDPETYRHKYLGGWLDQLEGTLFTKLNYYSNIRHEDIEAKVIYIDPAFDGLDYTVAVLGCLIGSKVYIEDVICTNQGTDYTTEIVPIFIHTHKPHYVYCENNGGGALFFNMIQKKVLNNAIIQVNNSTNKITRIINSKSFVFSNVYFKENFAYGSDYEIFMNQIKKFNKDPKLNDFDDSPDALAGLTKIIHSNYSHLY